MRLDRSAVRPQSSVAQSRAVVLAGQVVVNGVEPVRLGALDALIKRTIDVAVASVALLLGLPLLAAIALAVRLDSPGPVLFRQPRVGRGARVFTFYKFRTMYADARERFPHLYAYHALSRPEFEQMLLKTADDPRLTRFGRRLRTTSLDELPNLFNVLRGDMSLVGPRPELPEMVRHYLPEELDKFRVRPGVTGIWQVSGRALLRNLEQLRADVRYVRTRSLRLDLWILVRTVLVVVRRVGAY